MPCSDLIRFGVPSGGSICGAGSRSDSVRRAAVPVSVPVAPVQPFIFDSPLWFPVPSCEALTRPYRRFSSQIYKYIALCASRSIRGAVVAVAVSQGLNIYAVLFSLSIISIHRCSLAHSINRLSSSRRSCPVRSSCSLPIMFGV